MQLVINISKWPDDSPLEHIDTDIIIKDENDVTLFPEEKIFTNIWVKDIDIPVGSTYYITERKNFKVKGVPEDEQTISFENVIHTVTNNDGEISNMLLKEYVTIEKPNIYLKLKDIEDDNKAIYINTSSYRGKGDGHTHSHWIIKADGVVKYKSLRDEDSKTRLLVMKDWIPFDSTLEIFVTHCSNQIESEVAYHKISKSSINFKVLSNLINVPIADYTLSIGKITDSKLMKLSKVNVMQDGVLLTTYDINSDQDVLNLTIPRNFIEPNGILILELYGYTDEDKLTKSVHKLIPFNLSYEDNINKEYEYDKVFDVKELDVLVPNGLVSDNLYNKVIVPTIDGFKSYTYGKEDGLTNGNIINGLLHLGNTENILVKTNNDNTILIDCLNGDGKPTFLVYGYTNVNKVNTYYLLDTIIREDETATVSFNNSIEQISNDEFIYNVTGTNILKKYNKKTGEITILKDIGLEATSVTIVKLEDNQLLCFTNADKKTRLYDINKNSFIDGMIVKFSGYQTTPIKKVDLINGDKLLVRNVTEGNYDKVLYFDISEYTLTELDYRITNVNNNIILKNNNGVFLGNILPKDFINRTEDGLELISFT